MIKYGTTDMIAKPRYGLEGTGQYPLYMFSQVNVGEQVVWTSTATSASSYVCAIYDIEATGETKIANNINYFSGMSVDYEAETAAATSYTFTSIGQHTVFFYLNSNQLQSSAFLGVSDLKDVYLKGIGYIQSCAFLNCSKLKTVNLMEVDFQAYNAFGSSVFEGCSSLEYVGGIPNVLAGGESYYQACFRGCESLTGCTLPQTMQTVPLQLFYNCYNANITIPSSVTTIGAQAFTEVGKLDYPYGLVTIPASTALTSIGDYAFQHARIRCIDDQGNNTEPLVKLTSLQTIGNYAFQYCQDAVFDELLLGIPASVTSIGDYGLDYVVDSEMSVIEFRGTTPPTCGTSIFGPRTYPIYVPTGCVAAYQAALPEYASLIEESPY